MEAAAAKLLDQSQPFDVNLLDEIVNATFDPRNPQQATANTILMGLKENDQMWLRADAILEQSSNPNTRFFALQILTDTINTRWKILPADQREGIKNYIVGKLISITSDEAQVSQQKVFVSKMNQVLIQILKQEWPHNWPSFISDLVGASKQSEVLCENNMQILKLLSEEVFDFSKDAMTTAKTKTMKESLNEEFAKVYQLCEFILEASQRPSLLKVTLTTLQRFLSWIPLGYVFETGLVPTLVDKFFAAPAFRNEALECLTEIGSLPLGDRAAAYAPTVVQLYLGFLQRLTQALPPDTDLRPAFENGSEEDCLFVQRLALFFTSFFKAHLSLLETAERQQALLQGLYYLVCISEAPDDEVFKICLEYYHGFAQQLYQSETRTISGAVGALNLGGGGAAGGGGGGAGQRKVLYSAVLSRVRLVLVSRMAKPEEVLVVEDENGEIVRELTKDTEVIAQYKTMREALVYLTHLNHADTENILLEKLRMQVDGTEWGWNNLNTLCWAIGSISGAMNEEEEKRFLVTVIKDLLGLCEMKRGKDNKAVIAANIMYVVGQYPRFLRAHWKFLKTVVNKLFEFMHEKHPGVQDMACDTFLKIAAKCKRKFVTQQQLEAAPFAEELLGQLGAVISDLQPHQVHTFYEAVGLMLSDRGAAVQVDRPALLARLMELPNGGWQKIMEGAKADPQSLYRPETAKEVANILKTNIRVAKSCGPLYVAQLSGFFNEMLEVYNRYGAMISQAVAEKGALAVRYNEVRQMRGAKREVLRLLTTFVERAAAPEAPPAAVASDIVPPLLEPVLADYQGSIPGARDPQVLSMFAACVEKLQGLMAPSVPRIMAAVFECTLQMITTNMLDFPETRTNFFLFLKAVNQHCFEALFSIPPEHQKLVVDSVVWAFKHTERNIAETGLEILMELLQNVGRAPAVAQGFYQSFLLALIQDVLAVLTDRLHKSGFKLHAALLRHMFQLVEVGQVSAPLFDPAAHPGKSNQEFLREHVCGLLGSSFPNLTQGQVLAFVAGLFDLKMDLPSFKTHLRDFLIQLKEFSAEDNADLYTEETVRHRQQAEADLRQQKLAVPGLLNPHEIDDMADL